MITLMHIEGLSTSDLPLFLKPSDISSWAVKHKVADVSNVYFPPYYTNRIKFTSDDVDFDTQFNYLCFDFRNRIYYYFVDDISYISEDVIEVSITMDTLITYFFDVGVGDGEVCRAFVPRKKEGSSNLINRDYIRENLSNGEKRIIENRRWYSQYEYGMLCIVANRDALLDWQMTSFYHYHFEDFDMPTAFVCCFIPIPKGYNYDTGGEIKLVLNGEDSWTEETLETINVFQSLALLENDPNIQHIFYFPYLEPFVGPLNIIRKVGKATLPSDGKTYDIFYINTEWVIHNTKTYANARVLAPEIGTIAWVLGHNVTEVEIPLNLEPGDNELFDAWQEPAMMDNNYISYEFGDASSSSSCNLFDGTRPILVCDYTYDFVEGKTHYYCEPKALNYSYSGYVPDFDVKSAVPVEFSLSSSSWQTWWQQNKATIIGSVASDCVKGLAISHTYTTSHTSGHESGIKSQLEKSLTSNKTSTSYNGTNVSNITKEARSRNTYSPQAYSRNYNHDYSSERTYDPGMSFGSTLGVVTQMANAALAPDNLRSTGSITDRLLYDKDRIRLVTYMASDFQHVGLYYHKNGVLVSYNYTPLPTTPLPSYLLSSKIRVRKYFNVIKFKTCDCHLINVPETDAIVTDLNRRLTDGFRLWELGDDYETLIPMGQFIQANPDRS